MSNKEKARWLARHYQDVVEGGKSQYTNGASWYDADGGPCFHSIKSEWRVVMPPKLVPVDMSVLVGSGIDCEFWDEGELKIGALKGFEKRLVGTGNYYVHLTGELFECCQPRMDYWFSVMNFTNVEQLLSDLDKAGLVVKCDAWQAKAFQITGIAEGRCWPWEQGE